MEIKTKAPQAPSENSIRQLAEVLKVLGEPNRLLLLEKIIQGIQCNCELGKSLALSPNLVSHHLSVLCDSGLIKAERDQHDARWVYYSVIPEKLNELNSALKLLFDIDRIQPCLSTCGPNYSK